ncbi:hypothetical protein [Algibacillus agarilyticus]|uniref:hypothetical protein n=1 Tax=Algibacillus agarilyticus TaxID=2234133 RepID=UPI000DD05B9D|nr:hypothetical protein [Algibacillus agarilyticus]
MKVFLQISILLISIIVTSIFSYNQALKDSFADYNFIDVSKTYIALKLLREKGIEDTISFLESDLDSTIAINRTNLEMRSSLYEYINFQFPMNYEYYDSIIKYRTSYQSKNNHLNTMKNLNWLYENSSANKRINSDK